MSSNEPAQATQYLTFTLANEDFALEIGKVREVLDFTTITKVPRMPEYLRGVINLRGNVVPVIDLRLKLGMSATERTVDTCIVIVEIDMDGDLTQMGALADSVQEVIDLDPNQIAPPPRLGAKLNTNFIRGMGKQQEDRFLMILDIDQVVSGDHLLLHTESTDSAFGGEDSRFGLGAPHATADPAPPKPGSEMLEAHV